MKRLLPAGWMFPLAMLAFIGVSVQYTNILFTTTTRWAVLAPLLAYLLLAGRLTAGFRSTLGALVIVYGAWCVTTTLWSDVPALSGAKSLAQLLVIVAFVGGGFLWAQRYGFRGALWCLIPIVAVAALAGLGGGVSIEGNAPGDRFEGLTGNSNMLGSLAAMSMPMLLWQSFGQTSHNRFRHFWRVAALVMAVILALSVSRSAIGATLITGSGLLLSRGIRRGSLIVLAVTALIGFSALLAPEILQSTGNTYILKDTFGVLDTRAEVWAESYAQALKGGVFGGGFGATIGDTSFEGGLKSVGYGREQGNTQLAVWEQTGVVGLILYSLIVVALLWSALSVMRSARTGEDKEVAGIVLGALAGFLFMGVFEAWWVAPGSPESIFFWSLVGISQGLRWHVLAASRSGPRDRNVGVRRSERPGAAIASNADIWRRPRINN